MSLIASNFKYISSNKCSAFFLTRMDLYQQPTANNNNDIKIKSKINSFLFLQENKQENIQKRSIIELIQEKCFAANTPPAECILSSF